MEPKIAPHVICWSLRITKRFNPMSLGRHGVCLRKPRAGDPAALSVPASASGLVHRLSGRYTD
ncbi:MAG: hypothetical protein JWO30_1492 [Fibrobacteres bacterium]|nr:hypothetical protein [Fibrobacterota bacterium]